MLIINLWKKFIQLQISLENNLYIYIIEMSVSGSLADHGSSRTIIPKDFKFGKEFHRRPAMCNWMGFKIREKNV